MPTPLDVRWFVIDRAVMAYKGTETDVLYGVAEPLSWAEPLAQNTTQKSISIAFCVSSIRHDSSLSKYRKQKQSPPWKY